MDEKLKDKSAIQIPFSLRGGKKRKSFLFAGSNSIVIKKNSCANFILSYCVQVLIHNENLISLYEITTSPVCWYLFELSCSTVFLSVMCIMISGILIMAKCHMHVSQSWDLYTERKTNT